MRILTIRLFGNMDLIYQDKVTITLQPNVQIFLSYLLINRHRYHCREVLSGLFWGDLRESQARHCLSTTLWRLRHEMEAAGIPREDLIISNEAGEIGFQAQNNHYWLDIDDFENKASFGLSCQPAELTAAEVHHLEAAVQLYNGDLLEGVYADWVLPHREKLRATYIKCLVRLMHYYTTHSAYEQALMYGRKILEIDPLREKIHRRIMKLYIQNGDRAYALKQYEICCQTLDQELNIEPMPETIALYRQLLSSHPAIHPTHQPNANDQPPTTTPEELENFQQLLNQLDNALTQLEEVRGQLNQAISTIHHLIKQ